MGMLVSRLKGNSCPSIARQKAESSAIKTTSDDAFGNLQPVSPKCGDLSLGSHFAVLFHVHAIVGLQRANFVTRELHPRKK